MVTRGLDWSARRVLGAARRGRPGREACVVDGLTAHLTDAVGALVESRQGLFDLGELALDRGEDREVGRTFDRGRGRGMLRVHTARLGEPRDARDQELIVGAARVELARIGLKGRRSTN